MVSKEVMATLEAALKMTDQVMRDAATDDATETELVDIALGWAIASWLPSSSLFEGMLAYAVLPEDKHLATHYGRVFIAPVDRGDA